MALCHRWTLGVLGNDVAITRCRTKTQTHLFTDPSDVQSSHKKLIELRLTHQDMAEAIGTTRVTVTRLLRQFEQQGLVSLSRQQGILLLR